jgi:hypothetical protein
LRIRPDNTSAQRIKRYGGNGFPCLSPHWGTKLEVGFPSIRIEKETMVTHLIIVLTRGIGKPIETRVFRNKSILQKLPFNPVIGCFCHV